MSGYYIADARRLKRQIEGAIPEAQVENWRDYGFAVDVSIGERHCVACQPGNDDIGQPEIFRTIDEVKRLLSLH